LSTPDVNKSSHASTRRDSAEKPKFFKGISNSAGADAPSRGGFSPNSFQKILVARERFFGAARSRRRGISPALWGVQRVIPHGPATIRAGCIDDRDAAQHCGPPDPPPVYGYHSCGSEKLVGHRKFALIGDDKGRESRAERA